MFATCVLARQHTRLVGDDPAELDSVVASGAPHGYSGPEGFDAVYVSGILRERPNVGVRSISSSWIECVSPMVQNGIAMQAPLGMCAKVHVHRLRRHLLGGLTCKAVAVGLSLYGIGELGD